LRSFPEFHLNFFSILFLGFIKFLKSGELVKVNLNDKSEVIGTAEKVKEVIGTESFPKPTKYKNRCVDCCYRKMCWGG